MRPRNSAKVLFYQTNLEVTCRQGPKGLGQMRTTSLFYAFKVFAMITHKPGVLYVNGDFELELPLLPDLSFEIDTCANY